MCGRFTLTRSPEKISARFGLKPVTFAPRYNIAPTQEAPVLLCESAPEIKRLRWGLIPSWAKDESIGARIINARAEGLLEKPSFRKPLERRRCLVPADGYYEWLKSGAARVPYRFTLKEGSPFAFAGLWDTWRGPDGTPLSTFAIITTCANELARRLHNRMPVILAPARYEQWLDPKFKDLETLQDWLKPYPAGEMISYPVNPVVNNAAHDTVECVRPIETLRFRANPDLPGILRDQ